MERRPEKLTRMASVNLWEDFYWQERRKLLFRELRKNELMAGKGVVLALQEARVQPVNTVRETAEELGFSEREVYFFPTRAGGRYGLAFVTDLPVRRQNFQLLTHDPNDPEDFNQRLVAMAEVGDGKPVVAVVVHLSFSGRMQVLQAKEVLGGVKEFMVASLLTKAIPQADWGQKNLGALSRYLPVMIMGDLNADPESEAYQSFVGAGLTELTAGLRQRFKHSWPAEPEWYKALHVRTWGREPATDPWREKRWLDYIFGAGIYPQRVVLLGTEEKDGMYPSDHFMPMVVF